MANGLRTAKPGKSVASSDTKDYLYTSEALSIKVFMTASGTLKTDSNGFAELTIKHGLDYPPSAWFYINPPQSIVNDSVSVSGSWGFADNVFQYVISNADSVRLILEDNEANTVYKYKYYIFVEPAKDE
jgi:hypothetical protein